MQNSYSSSPQAIITSQFYASLFESLDNSSENTPLGITLNYFERKTSSRKNCKGFYTEKYITKGYLLQYYWLLSEQIKMARNITNRL